VYKRMLVLGFVCL